MDRVTNRLKHCHCVGLKMAEIVRKNPSNYTCTPEQAYVLGLLHDFGYEFADKQEDHDSLAAMVLKQSGYTYWREVLYHSSYQTKYDSPMLRLLYYADMVIGPAGEEMTMKDRVDEIAIRYGKDSLVYKETVELFEILTDMLFSKDE